MVGDADINVDGAEVTALRETLISGLHCQVELVLRLEVQRFGHTDGAQLWINGKDAVDISCRKTNNMLQIQISFFKM